MTRQHTHQAFRIGFIGGNQQQVWKSPVAHCNLEPAHRDERDPGPGMNMAVQCLLINSLLSH